MNIYSVTSVPVPWNAVQLQSGTDHWIEMFDFLSNMGLKVLLLLNSGNCHEDRIEVGYGHIMRTGDWFLWSGIDHMVVDYDEFNSRWELVS